LAQNLRHSNWTNKWIWQIDTLPKIQIFLWQMFHHALPGTLFRRGVNLNHSFPLCVEDIETMDHLFKDCCDTKRAWEFAVKHRWIDTVSVADRGQDLPTHPHRIKTQHSMHNVIQKISFLLWSIWKCRNKVVFSNEVFNPLACLLATKKAFVQWRIRSSISTDDFFQGALFSPCHHL